MPVYTKSQSYAVSMLRKLRSVRHDQMYWLIERECPGAKVPASTEMRRLNHLGKAVDDGRYYYWPGCGLDGDLIAALDIMRRVAGDARPVFELRKPPCKLSFFVNKDGKNFACHIYFPKQGEELESAAEAELLSPGQAVIFCIESRSQIPLLNIGRPHIFACPDGNGGYEFVSGQD